MLTKVDEAISAASAGESNAAVEKLNDVSDGIDEHLDSDASREVALGLLAGVYDALGLEIG
jgi:hypothetical protein